LDSGFEFSYYWRGLTYYAKKEYEKAEYDFNKVIELNPNNKSALNFLKDLKSLKQSSEF
jgi:tetratricopeptide (TPR) repeat protein